MVAKTCNGSLLCEHGVVERKRISSLERHRKALEKECCLWVSSVIVAIRLHYYYYYYFLNIPGIIMLSVSCQAV